MSDPRVLSFSAHTTTGEAARFTVGTDIIDYMESSRVFGREDLSDPNGDGRFQRRMVAIPDKKWNVVTPMVLTISNQNQLYFVRKDDESEGGDGWKLIDLSQAFKSIMGNSIRVRAHAAGWTDHDRITIAVAVDDGSSETSRVFVAYDLSSRTSNWENISWIDCGSREDIRVEGIRVLDGGDNTWTVVLAGDHGPNDTLYLLRNTFPKSFAQALIFNPAVTLEEILDFEVAVHPTLGAGIAVLGISGGTRDLSFRPFPAYKADGSFSTIPPVEPLPCPTDASVLETGLTKLIQKGRRKTYMGSDIYVGGQGVHLIQASDVLKVVINGGEIPLMVVTSPEAAPNVQDLIVGEAPDGSASVWSLLQNGDLNTVKKVSANAAWGEPLRLRIGVQAIAPVHGDEHLTTSLLMVYANGQASFLVRDASQGIWQERPLTVANPEEVSQITCYGTTLRVLSEGSLPQIGKKVKVSASVLSSVVVNGCAVFIGPNVSFETETDFNGSIKLFDRVRSLTPAIYRFEIEGFDQCIDVNPAAGMHERFQSLTADELRSATISTAEGDKPLLSESFRTGADQSKVDMLVGSLNQLSSLTNSASGIVAGVSLVSPDQPFSSTLHPEVASDDYRWGIKTDENGVSHINNTLLDQIIYAGESVGEFFKNLGEGIADFFEGLAQGFKEGGLKGGLTFVLYKAKEGAEKAWEFVCKIGNEIKRFAIKTWEEISGVFKWLWEWVKLKVEDAWELLKFVFDWQDILRVRDAMVDTTDMIFHYVENSIETIKEDVSIGFDSLINQINSWQHEAGEAPQKIEKASPGKSFLNTISKATEPVQDVLDQVTGNSAVAWITDKINDLFDEIIEFDTPEASPDLVAAVTEFFEGSVSSMIDELWNTFRQIQEDINNLFGGDFPDISSMNFETIKQLLVSISSETLQGFLNLSKQLILNTLDLVKKLIGFLRSILFTKIRFPFIEKLVKLVTAGSTSIDTSFTLVEGIMLMIAVPSTIAYKCIFKESPLDSGDTLIFPNGAITIQSGTDKSLKFSSRIVKLTSSFLKVFVTAIKIDCKAKGLKTEWVVYDTPKFGKGAVSLKVLDALTIILGGLSYTGSTIGYFGSSTDSKIASVMFGIDTMNFVIPAWLTQKTWKKHGKEDWKKMIASTKKLAALTTVVHLILRSVDFGIQADKFASIGNKENAKIVGYVGGTSSGLSACLSGLSACSTDTTRQVGFEATSLAFSIASIPLGITEACLS